MPLPDPGEVHVWHLELAGGLPEHPYAGLDEAERGRAARLRFDRDRARFVRAHRAVRRVLGGYLGMPGEQVRFEVDARGKPSLAGAPGLGFNLSHSGDHGLLAVGRAAQLGVDIEEIVARDDVTRLARTVFSAAEMRALEAYPEADRTRPFLTGWTRKEAYLKALGIGLGAEPAEVHVGIHEARSVIAATLDAAHPEIDVAVIPGHERCVAALAVAGGWTRLTHHHVPGRGEC